MNLHYRFNVQYYAGFPDVDYTGHNDKMIKQRFQQDESEEICFAEHSFTLKTVYPGLLLGLGNTHEAGNALITNSTASDAEIKLGFTMDYATGLPVIPGSTVKGVLRSAFCAHAEYVKGLLPDLPAVEDLVEAVFGKDDMGKVVFFDAIPIKAGRADHLFGLENITPHKAKDPEYDGLVNPTPLTLLKVIPGVSFLFRFGFYRWNDKNRRADALLKAFKEILITLGIGAKTNVGFGVMDDAGMEPPYYTLAPIESLAQASAPQTRPAVVANPAQTAQQQNASGTSTPASGKSVVQPAMEKALANKR